MLGIAEIMPHSAVEVHVNQARNHIAALRVHVVRAGRARCTRWLNAREPVAFHHHVALAEALSIEHHAVDNSHIPFAPFTKKAFR